MIHDIGAPHGSDGTSSLILEAQPIVDVDNIVSNDHPWHCHLPLAALSVIRRQESLFSTTVCRPGAVTAARLRIGGRVNRERCLVSPVRRNRSTTLHWRLELKSSTRAHAPIIHGH